MNRLIETSLGSNWTRLYDSVSCSFEVSCRGVLTHGAVSVLFAINILILLLDTLIRSDSLRRPYGIAEIAYPFAHS